MRARLAAALSALLLAHAAPARAEVAITVDKAAQRMEVSVDGRPRYAWPVSTGLPAYDTPAGAYRPFRMERAHVSREWDDAPMPFAVFFTNQGHAIHGTTHARRLGRAASHGCVRLSLRNAATLFGLVRAQGMGATRIRIVGADAVMAGRGGGPRSVARRDNGPASFDDDQTGARAAGRFARRPPPAYGYGYAAPGAADIDGW